MYLSYQPCRINHIYVTARSNGKIHLTVTRIRNEYTITIKKPNRLFRVICTGFDECFDKVDKFVKRWNMWEV